MSPVRKIQNHRNTYTGKFPSLKMGRMIGFESRLEKDFIYLLEYDKRVSHFEEQPLKIEYTFHNKTHTYTPDFHVVFEGENWLYECKPDKFMSLEENLRKFQAAKVWCDERGWGYQVAKESDIRSGYRLDNVKYLYGFARHNISPILKAQIYGFIQATNCSLTVADLGLGITEFQSKEIYSAVFHMAFHHKLILPLDEALISLQTTVRLI